MTIHTLMGPGGATEAKQDDILAALALTLIELQAKFEAGQQVALDAATLAALENVNAVISGTVALDAPTLAALENIGITNFPADYPDGATLAKLEAIRALLAAPLIVALDAPTLAALEHVSVDNFPAEVEVKNDAGNPLSVGDLNKLVPVRHDEVVLSYTGENLTGVVFKLATVTVATLTLAYTGDRLDSVVRT